MGLKKFAFCFIAVICLFINAVSIHANDDKNKEIVNRLLSRDKEEADKALSYISFNKPPGVLPLLVPVILADKSRSNKEIAINAFKSFPQKDTVNYCFEILNKTNSFMIRRDIINYVSIALDNRLIPLVIKELRNPFFTVRESAIFALRKRGNDKVFPYILNMMESENPVEKVYALEAIFYLYDLRFYNQLVNMLKDENKSIRYFVLKCIEENKLKEALPSVRNSALSDNSWEVRVKAIQILETLLDRDSMFVLLNCLKDKEREIRYSSARALNRLLFKSSAFQISTGLYEERDDEIKEILINLLISINDAGGYKGIRQVLLKDNNYRMKVLASYSLGSIKTSGSWQVLLEGINDSSKEVRAEVCSSLSYYFDKKIIDELIKVVDEDSEMYVRSAALFSLLKIGSKYALGSRYAIPSLFDIYSSETDPVFKDQVRIVLRELIKDAGFETLRKS